ncbi:MAG TPA: hypothetical protein ENO09_06630 [bacterium]|nr:hypothetical protein [bacterium]
MAFEAALGRDALSRRHKPSVMPILLLYPRSSLRLRVTLLGGHGLVLLALWLAALPWWLAMMLSAALGVSAWKMWHQALPVRSVQWGRDGLWQLELSDGVLRNAHLIAATSRSWPWWVYLDFRLEDGRRLGLVLAADALSEALFRQLRARLKIESAVLSQ